MLLPHSSASKRLWGQGEGPIWDVIPGGSQPSLPCQSSHVFSCALQSSRLCSCTIPWGTSVCASPCLVPAGTVSLSQATALASACDVGAHLGHCQLCP